MTVNGILHMIEIGHVFEIKKHELNLQLNYFCRSPSVANKFIYARWGSQLCRNSTRYLDQKYLLDHQEKIKTSLTHRVHYTHLYWSKTETEENDSERSAQNVNSGLRFS